MHAGFLKRPNHEQTRKVDIFLLRTFNFFFSHWKECDAAIGNGKLARGFRFMSQLIAFLSSLLVSAGTFLSSPQAAFWVPSLLGLGGSIAGAFIGARGQKRATQQTIESEYNKIQRQSTEQSIARLRARKEDVISERVVELLISSDPELNTKPDYCSIVRAVHSIQLFLDLSSQTDRILNGAIQELAFTARTFLLPEEDDLFVSRLSDLQKRGLDAEALDFQHARDEEMHRQLLACQAKVIEAAQSFLGAATSAKDRSDIQKSMEPST